MTGGGSGQPDAPALILVVDDTPASRYITSSWLRRNGHQVIEAGTGTDALDALASWPIDLVVLDVNLPDINGFEVCERIKNDPSLGQPVIHLSATAVGASDKAQGLTGGADAYLVDPVEPEELLATVSAVLRNSRARAVAEGLADRLAKLSGRAAVLAADSLRLYKEEHTLALALQRSFLPEPPRELLGLELAMRYIPAERNAEIGGDFYEFIQLDDRRLLVAIGDVAGHSTHAATVMVELRHALRAYAVEGHGPAEILGLLERMLQHYHPQEFATLCLMILIADRDEMVVANAGHLPPLLVEHGGARFVPVGGPMLGLRHPKPTETLIHLPPAWSIVLVTDGLVESPGVDLDDAMAELRVAASVDAGPDELCERLLERFHPAGLDDVALVVVRRPG